jgi:SAM-dependent methyltransferase
MKAFGAYAHYYNLLYRNKDYVSEANYVHGLIQLHSPKARSILDLGCGTGAHAVQLAKIGYDVHGLDVSQDMLEIARSSRAQLPSRISSRLSFLSGDIRVFRSDQRFDVVTALFHVMSYQVNNDDVTHAFATAAAHLIPGGIFLFDCWYGPAVLTDPPSVRIKRLEDENCRVLRIAEPTMSFNQNTTEVNYQVLVTEIDSGITHEIRELHTMRYFFGPELKRCLEDAKMELLHIGEWMSDHAASEKSWNVVIVGRAQSDYGR